MKARPASEAKAVPGCRTRRRRALAPPASANRRGHSVRRRTSAPDRSSPGARRCARPRGRRGGRSGAPGPDRGRRRPRRPLRYARTGQEGVGIDAHAADGGGDPVRHRVGVRRHDRLVEVHGLGRLLAGAVIDQIGPVQRPDWRAGRASVGSASSVGSSRSGRAGRSRAVPRLAGGAGLRFGRAKARGGGWPGSRPKPRPSGARPRSACRSCGGPAPGSRRPAPRCPPRPCVRRRPGRPDLPRPRFGRPRRGRGPRRAGARCVRPDL
jgi:hypothetical protein